MKDHSISVWFACKPCNYVFHCQSIAEFIDHKKQVHFHEFRKAKCIVLEEKEINEEQFQEILNCKYSLSQDCVSSRVSNPDEERESGAFSDAISKTISDENNTPVVDSKLFSSFVRVQSLTPDEHESSMEKGKHVEEFPVKVEPLSENSDSDDLEDNDYEPPPCIVEYNNSLSDSELDLNFDAEQNPPREIRKISTRTKTKTKTKSSVIPNSTKNSRTPFSCKVCGKSFRFKSYLPVHEKTHSDDRPYKCSHPDCSQAFKTLKNLRAHEPLHLNPEDRPKRPKRIRRAHGKQFKCELCPKEYFDKTSLLFHQETHKSLEDQSRPFICEMCGSAFKRLDYLKEHLLIHSDQRPYDCLHPGCGRAFKSKKHLREHQKSHIEIRTYKCHLPDCDKAFKTKTHLTAHVKTHINSERVPCTVETCGKTFASAASFKIHFMKSHMETDKRFECEICHKTFGHNSSLKWHTAMHSEEKPFKCTHEGCTTEYFHQKSLTEHELSHAGEKPFQCDVCGKAFLRNKNLLRHIRGNCSIQNL